MQFILLLFVLSSEWKGLREEEDPTEMLAAANAVLVMWLRDQLIQLPDGQRLAIVSILSACHLAACTLLCFTYSVL